MAAADEVIDPLEDLQVELGKVVTNQSAQLLRQDTAISNIVDCIGDLSAIVKDLQSSLGGSRNSASPEARAHSGQNATRSIHLGLLKFQGTVQKDGFSKLKNISRSMELRMTLASRLLVFI